MGVVLLPSIRIGKNRIADVVILMGTPRRFSDPGEDSPSPFKATPVKMNIFRNGDGGSLGLRRMPPAYK